MFVFVLSFLKLKTLTVFFSPFFVLLQYFVLLCICMFHIPRKPVFLFFLSTTTVVVHTLFLFFFPHTTTKKVGHHNMDNDEDWIHVWGSANPQGYLVATFQRGNTDSGSLTHTVSSPSITFSNNGEPSAMSICFDGSTVLSAHGDNNENLMMMNRNPSDGYTDTDWFGQSVPNSGSIDHDFWMCFDEIVIVGGVQMNSNNELIVDVYSREETTLTFTERFSHTDHIFSAPAKLKTVGDSSIAIFAEVTATGNMYYGIYTFTDSTIAFDSEIQFPWTLCSGPLLLPQFSQKQSNILTSPISSILIAGDQITFSEDKNTRFSSATTGIGECSECGEGYQCGIGTAEIGTEGELSRVPCGDGEWSSGTSCHCDVNNRC